MAVGRGNKIEVVKEMRFPSLGLLYSAFTAYCGFEINEGVQAHGHASLR